MKWVSIVSLRERLNEGVEEIVSKLKSELDGKPSLIIAFLTTGYSYQLPDFSLMLREEFPECLVIGCNASSIINGEKEIAEKYAITVLAASGLSKNLIEAVHVDGTNLPSEDDSPAIWRKHFGLQSKMNQSFIILADSFSPRVEKILNGLDYAYRGTIVGGFASGALFKGENIFYLNEKVYNHGVIVLDLGGQFDLIPVVAQGCKPIGEELLISKCDNVVLEEVNGQSPLSYLRELSGKLDARDRELLQGALYLGVESTEIISKQNKTDYLIRNIQGLNVDSGALVVGENLQKGQSIKFFVRDADISRREIERISESLAIKLATRHCLGILVFSCTGRGKEFYGVESVDVKFLRKINEDAAVSGFFCNGEIAPLSGVTYIHSYTTVAVLIFERDR